MGFVAIRNYGSVALTIQSWNMVAAGRPGRVNRQHEGDWVDFWSLNDGEPICWT